MNLNASVDTIRNVAEAMKLAQLLDDRTAHADKARIAVWAEQVEPFDLPLDDLLDGVRAYYADPRERPIGVGDLIAAARAIRRDRNERESAEQMRARQEALDARVAEAISEAADALPVIPAVRVFTRPSQRADGKPNPLSVRCPWCHAGEFRPCQTPGTNVILRNPHPSRVETLEGLGKP